MHILWCLGSKFCVKSQRIDIFFIYGPLTFSINGRLYIVQRWRAVTKYNNIDIFMNMMNVSRPGPYALCPGRSKTSTPRGYTTYLSHLAECARVPHSTQTNINSLMKPALG